MLVGVDIYYPSLLVNLDDSSDYNISYIRFVPLSEWLYAHNSVDLVDNTCHICVNQPICLVMVGAMACNQAFTDIVAWKHYAHVSLCLDLFLEVDLVDPFVVHGRTLHFLV